jgi:hypothetical protein
MTSYQKLKSQNERLKKEIQILIYEPNSGQALAIRAGWELKRHLEEAVWGGQRDCTSIGRGILNQISK